MRQVEGEPELRFTHQIALLAAILKQAIQVRARLAPPSETHRVVVEAEQFLQRAVVPELSLLIHEHQLVGERVEVLQWKTADSRVLTRSSQMGHVAAPRSTEYGESRLALLRKCTTASPYR